MFTHQPPSSGGSTDWLVTYGDMMTIVVTFFVLMVAMSQVREEDQLQDTLSAMHKQFSDGKQTIALTGGALPRDPALASAINTGRRRRAEMFAVARKELESLQSDPDTRRNNPDAPLLILELTAAKPDFTLSVSATQKSELRHTLSAADDRAQRTIEIRALLSSELNAGNTPEHCSAGCRACIDALVAQGVNPGRIRTLVIDDRRSQLTATVGPTNPPARPVRLELYLRDE